LKRKNSGTEILKRKIVTNREIFQIFSKMAELSNKAENLKKKNCNKPRKISDFKQNGGIEQQSGNS